MNIYKHRATVTTDGGSVGSTTLNIRGGLCRQLLIRALTAPTVTIFRADITDENGVIVRNYGYRTGELNVVDDPFPMSGANVVNITNASQTDTFVVMLGIQE